MFVHDQADRLIDLIYDAAAESSPWSEPIGLLTRMVNARTARLMVHQPLHNSSLVAEEGIDPDAHREFCDTYYQINPYAEIVARRKLYARPLAIRSEDILPAETLVETAYYQDYLRRFGLGRFLAGVVNAADEPDVPTSLLMLTRPLDQPAFEDEAIATLQTALPHLRRALRLQVQCRRQREIEARVVDSFALPVLVLDRQLRIIRCNAAAETWIARGRVNVVRGSVLAPNAGAQTMLQQALRQGGGMPPRAAVSLWEAGPPPKSWAEVAPVALAGRFGLTTPPAAQALLVLRSTQPSGASGTLRRLYGLTPAEAALAVALYQGDCPNDYAGHRGVSITTVRSQLRSIFAKTGTSRQTDVIRLVAQTSQLLETRAPETAAAELETA